MVPGIVLAMLLTGPSAAAERRPDIRTMNCADARALIFQRGAVVATTGENTYQRFVDDQLQCQPFDEIAVPAVAATRDNPQCWVGSVCRNRGDFKSDD
ncbi:MAG TPA: hypothetical protein VK862_13090 [Afifellaceae bacterium]|nr:hypothetical protein [Afifellaceae bacterium]